MDLHFLVKIFNRVIPKSENNIVFMDGRIYPDAIYALLSEYYACKQKKGFKHISVVYSSENKPYLDYPNLSFIKYGKIISFFRIFRAKYIVTDIMFGSDYINDRQIVINIWHGVGLKKILGMTEEFKESKIPLAQYAMSYSPFFDEIVSKCFLIDKSRVITSGSPRNDLFFVGDRQDLDYIENGISEKKKVIIWMPTYRRSSRAASKNDGKAYPFGIPLIDETNVFELNKILLKNDMYLIIKHHILQDQQNNIDTPLSNIKIITSNDVKDLGLPLYRIIGQCDALITDYSSIFFEYMSLNRPICFAYDDYDEYERKRGFMFENSKRLMVGYHATDIKLLIQFIEDLSKNIDRYQNDRMDFIEEAKLYCDCNNSYRFLKMLGFVE